MSHGNGRALADRVVLAAGHLVAFPPPADRSSHCMHAARRNVIKSWHARSQAKHNPKSRRNVTLSHGTRIQAKRNPKPWHTRSQAKRNPMACTQPGGRNPKATTCTQPDERNPKAMACTQPDERNPQAMASIGARRSRREPLCRRVGARNRIFSSCLVKMQYFWHSLFRVCDVDMVRWTRFDGPRAT